MSAVKNRWPKCTICAILTFFPVLGDIIRHVLFVRDVNTGAASEQDAIRFKEKK